MKKTMGLLAILCVTMVFGYQNCSSGGGGSEAPSVVAQDACANLDFTAASLIYDNDEHETIVPAVQAKAGGSSTITKSDVRMNLNLDTGAISLDDEGTVCTMTLPQNDLQVLKDAIVGIRFCGAADSNAIYNLSLRGAAQEVLSMDSPSVNNIELPDNRSVQDLLTDISDLAQDVIDNGNCGGNSNQGSSQNN